MYRTSELSQRYKEKLITADQAAALVEPGYHIHFGLGCGCVYDIDEALSRRADELKDIRIISTTCFRKEPFLTYQTTTSNDQVMFFSAHYGPMDRLMSKAGRCWYIPMLFRELPKYWDRNDNRIDIAYFQTTPMDSSGNFNLGPQVADMWGVIKSARRVVVEVNQKMPKALGKQTQINLATVDYVVEGSNTPLPELTPKEPTETDRKIATHVVRHIHDNSTIQLGIGALPSCIGSMLAESDLRNVNAHTEMLVDGYLDLYRAGKLTGNKPVERGKALYSFAGGSQDLYDFIDDNPICCTAPVNFVNDISVIASINNFISINSCIQVDLYGQVSSESSGLKQISGTGGQLDFVMGSFLSHGGHSFLCTPSTRINAQGEPESLISPVLDKGSIITTPRQATNFIVTEYGAVDLKGKSTWERAELLISIAHPKFRENLIRSAERMGIWARSNRLPL